MTKLFKTTEQAKKEQEQIERELQNLKRKFTPVDSLKKGYLYENDPEKRRQYETEYRRLKRDLDSRKERNKNAHAEYCHLRNKSSELDEHFVEYLNTVKKSKSVEVLTGNTVIDEGKYNNYVKELENKYSDLVKEFVNLKADPNNCTMQTLMDLQRKRAQLDAQMDAVKREYNNVSADDKRFKVPEKIKIDITPMEAYLTFKELSNEQDSIQDEWKRTVLENIRNADKSRMALVSEEDWADVKRTYNVLMRFTKPSGYLNGNQQIVHHHTYDWTDQARTILTYDTKNDYLNREISDSEMCNNKFRERPNFEELFDYENVKLIQSIMYLKQLFASYKVDLENKKIAEEVKSIQAELAEDIKSMKDGLDKKPKKSKKSNKTDEV